ncbi:hypothetical protein EDC04DRAFT_1309749 [Pisolithus marmoratus]|nr:hypothetical protein EDC04DRAFT_1309749 [Pisolithus marmoratus]
MHSPNDERDGPMLEPALDGLRLSNNAEAPTHSEVPVLPLRSNSPNPWADELPRLEIKPVSTPDPACREETSIFKSSTTSTTASRSSEEGADLAQPRDVLREFDPLLDQQEFDAHCAWAGAEGHPPPPGASSQSANGIPGRSRPPSLDLSRNEPSRPSTPVSQAPSASPFPSLASIARSFSIPSVAKSAKPRPTSMDTAKPIAPPTPRTVASFAAQQQEPPPSQSGVSLPSPNQVPAQQDKSIEENRDMQDQQTSTPSNTESGSEAPRKAKDPSFDFQKFLDQMKLRNAEPVAKYLRSFLSNFAKRTFTVNDQVKIINDFLNFISSKMRETDIWRNASDAEFDNAMEGMEKLVMNKLYDFTFTPNLPLLNPPRPVTADDLERDRVLTQRIALFQWVKPSHLDTVDLENDDPAVVGFLDFAQQELCKVNHYKAPRDKLICILNCCKVIFGLLRHLHKEEGADSFVPILIYVVLKANPDHLLSNVEFVNRFRNPVKLQSEAGYYLSSLMGAVQFIETMDHTSLSNITQEEFERNVEAVIRSLPPSLPSSPTSPASSLSPSILATARSSHAGEESAQPLTIRTPSQAHAQSLSEDARRLLQKTGDAVSKPLNAISRIFNEAFDEKMTYLPGPFAPLELGRERAREEAGEGSESRRTIADHSLPETPASGDNYGPPLQTPYKPRVRKASAVSPAPSYLSEGTPTRPRSVQGGPYTNQPLALGPSQSVQAPYGSRPLNPFPQHLQPPNQTQPISRTPTPSLDLSAVQAEIDRAHAHASAASRATLAQIFPVMDAEVREWVLEANGGDLGKSIEALLEMSAAS